LSFSLRNEDIYEAALDPEAADRLPNLLTQSLGGRAAVLSWRQLDGTPDVLAYSHLSPEMMADYVNTFAPHDIWSIQAMSPTFANRMLSDEDIVSPSQFKSSVFYNDFIRRYGEDIFHVLGGSQTSAFGNGLLGIYRNRGDQPFSTDEKIRLTEIMGNLRSALMLRGRLSAARRAAGVQSAAWDATPLASIIVRADGRIVKHNAAAQTVLERADGVQTVKNVLRTVSQGHQGRLMRAIRLATTPVEPTGSSLQLETAAGVQYLISIVPISEGSGPSLALVLFKDPLRRQDFLQGQLQSIWGLTPHEALVATELAQGRAITEIAQRRRVSENTVKTQIKSISAKMSVRGQVEIIANILALP
jgi:DNA-binding CsgD family transcriptional regulator